MPLAPDEPPGDRGRSHCTRCDGTGIAVELRVIWKEPRAVGPPQRCSRLVESEEDAEIEMGELRERGALEVDCLTFAKK